MTSTARPPLDPKTRARRELIVTLVGGMLAGPTEAVCLMPVDVIKTRLQLGMGPPGMLPLARHIIKEEGVRALWKGCSVFAGHLFTKYIVRWGCASKLSQMFRDKDGRLNFQRRFAAGATAGILESILIVTPFEVVKTRLQQQKGTSNLYYKGPVDGMRKIVRDEGVKALWKGVIPTASRNMFNMSSNLAFKPVFDKAAWGHEPGMPPLPTWKTLITGCFSGCMGPLMNMPLDVAKTRMMAQKTVAGELPKYQGTFHCIKTVATEEGITALWKGYFPRVARVGPGFAIQWGVIDVTTKCWPVLFPNWYSA
eukprot:TRINITY_DN8279_c0_g1_i1.p1 TRINITY_DN8279_c0_g1~~TRINITY_DN8279_c0_g1_i1.p1  ORF type:complete len:310 (+),score=44.50 TRINITY_DN8279_c0_g1_i1:66-995(+)